MQVKKITRMLLVLWGGQIESILRLWGKEKMTNLRAIDKRKVATRHSHIIRASLSLFQTNVAWTIRWKFGTTKTWRRFQSYPVLAFQLES